MVTWLYIRSHRRTSQRDRVELTEESYSYWSEQSQKEKCLAVGEIGLDYYWPEPESWDTEEVVRGSWIFARETGKARYHSFPDAAKDTVDLMTGGAQCGRRSAVIHRYSHTKETAKIFLDMGFTSGIGGAVDFKNAKKLKEAVEYIPMDRIVLSIWIARIWHRNRTAANATVPEYSYVIAAMAQIKRRLRGSAQGSMGHPFRLHHIENKWSLIKRYDWWGIYSSKR